MKFKVHSSTLAILTLAAILAAAAPALAQPNLQAQVDACARQYPEAFACAHVDGRPCKADFVILCARDLSRVDPAVGLNWKRGNVGDPSLDVLGYRGVGPTRDIVNGGMMATIDIIACAGGDPGVCSPSVIWRVYNAAESPIGGWADPFSLQPSSGGTPQPPPTGAAAWEPKHAELLSRIASRFPVGEPRVWVRLTAEQFAFSFPGEGWGTKAADGSRPQSPDVIARQTAGRLIGYRVLNPAPVPNPAPIDLAGQHFIPVAAFNHLGDTAPVPVPVPGPTPVPPTPTPAPAPTVNLQPVLDAIAELRARLETLLTQQAQDLSTAAAAADSAAKQAALAASQTEGVPAALERLKAWPTTFEYPEYRFDVLGRPVIARPRK